MVINVSPQHERAERGFTTLLFGGVAQEVG